MVKSYNDYDKEIGWDTIEKGIDKICRYLEAEAFIPDLMICVPGAGLIITELTKISMGLELIPTYSLVLQPKGITSLLNKSLNTFEASGWKFTIPQSVYEEKRSKILVIDDFARTGDTLFYFRKELLSAGIQLENIKIISLISRKGILEEKEPDYTVFWEETYKIGMPWGNISKIERVKNK